MKIVCMINSLGSGGAQRQICMLAVLLKQRGYDVVMYICYKDGFYEDDFFRPFLINNGISVYNYKHTRLFLGVCVIKKAFKKYNPDIVVSYLNGPNLLAELASLFFRKYALVVSERNLDLPGQNRNRSIRFFCHRIADVVVPNAYAQQEYIDKAAPWLSYKTQTIVNCVDIEKFDTQNISVEKDDDTIRVVVLGRFSEQKNPVVLVKAMGLVRQLSPQSKIVIDWYGNRFFVDGKPTVNSNIYLEVVDEINNLNLNDHFILHEPVSNPVDLYRKATVVCLPSLYEGCANVICEALASGKPVLASRVSDNIRMVIEGENGFLFDPEDPEEIANVLIKFSKFSSELREKMCIKSRALAVEMLSPDRFVQEYIDLFDKIKRQ